MQLDKDISAVKIGGVLLFKTGDSSDNGFVSFFVLITYALLDEFMCLHRTCRQE
jgi:hypothetical protein